MLALLLAACGDDSVQRGQLISTSLVAPLTKATIDQGATATNLIALTGPATCDVGIHRMAHFTNGPDGKFYVVSGAVLVPSGSGCNGPFPMVSYNRGTEPVKARTMANPSDGETFLLAAMLAAQGYVVAATDYLGYAESDHPYHPYLHNSTQASTTIDSIRAARSVAAGLRVPLNGQLFVTGYSQGGHAAMGTHQAIEADSSLGITVTAAGPMSGPYNLAGSFRAGAALLPSGTAGSTVFTPFVVSGYQRIYGGLYQSPAEYYKQPYVTGIESLLPGTLGFTELLTQGKLPLLLGDLLQPKAVADVLSADSKLQQALVRNSLLDWKPTAPVLLCAGGRDPVVLYRNSVEARDSMVAKGATSVTLVNVEDVPQFAPALPAPGAPIEALASYHGTVVPPLCLKVVRDSLFAPLRSR